VVTNFVENTFWSNRRTSEVFPHAESPTISSRTMYAPLAPIWRGRSCCCEELSMVDCGGCESKQLCEKFHLKCKRLLIHIFRSRHAFKRLEFHPSLGNFFQNWTSPSRYFGILNSVEETTYRLSSFEKFLGENSVLSRVSRQCTSATSIRVLAVQSTHFRLHSLIV